MIEGKGNGAWLAGLVQGASFALVVAMLSFMAAVGTGAIWVLWVILALLFVANLLVVINNYEILDPESANCYLGGLGVGLAVAGFFSLKLILGQILTAMGIALSVGTNASTNPTACGL